MLLWGCGFKPVVGQTEAITKDTEFAYLLVGIETAVASDFFRDWGIEWLRTDEDVVFSELTGWDVLDRLTALSSKIVSGDEFEGTIFYLRKVRPGNFRLLNLTRRDGRASWATKPNADSIVFSAPRAQVSYIGTFELGLHKSGCLLPIGYRGDADRARRYLQSFENILVPIKDLQLDASLTGENFTCKSSKPVLF